MTTFDKDSSEATAVQVVANYFPRGEAVQCTARAGQTLREILGPGASHSLSVEIGGREVSAALWAHVRPKAGQIIYVHMFPQGGSGGRKWERAVLMIVLVIAAYYTGGLASAAYGSGYGAAAEGAVLVAGTYAINAMVPPAEPMR